MEKTIKRKNGMLIAIHVAGVTVVTSTPVFLPGAANNLIRDELGLKASDIGLVFTLYWIGSAIGAYISRRANNSAPVERIISLSLFVTSCSLLFMYIYPSIGLWIGAAIGGCAYGYSQPYTNFLIMRKCHSQIQGFAFGLKQAAIPVATLLYSLSIPLIAIPLGWQKVFGIIATLTMLYATLTTVLFWNSDTRKRKITTGRERVFNKHLLFLAIAGACGAMIGNTLGGFLITSLTHKGFSIFSASMVAVAASITNILVRIFAGIATDRSPSLPTKLLTQMFIIGTIGTAMLTLSSSFTQVLGAILAYGGGWGWAGLLHYVTGKSYPGNEGQATAISQMGVSIGAAIGPLLYGYLFSSLNVNIAWLAMAIVGLTACVVITLANRLHATAKLNQITNRRDIV